MNIKKSLMVALCIVGVIVGAGFSSGREVYAFFAKYGIWCLPFCLLVGVLFFLITYFIFSFNSSDKQEEERDNIGHKNKKCKIIKNNTQNHSRLTICRIGITKFNFFKLLMWVCQIIICSAMIAGLDELISMIGVKEWVFVCKIIILILAYLFLCFSDKGVYFINIILSVLLMVCIIVLFVLLCFKGVNVEHVSFSARLTYMPLLYVSMNAFVAYPLINNFARDLCRKERVLASVMVGIFLFVLLLLVSLCVMFGQKMTKESMIMVGLAKNFSMAFGVLYLALVFLSVATTLLSTAKGSAVLTKERVGYELSLFLSIVLSFVLSMVGFAKIVDVLYPFLGVICLMVFMGKIIVGGIKHRKI